MLCFVVSEYFIRTLRVHDKTILELQHNLICVGSLEKYRKSLLYLFGTLISVIMKIVLFPNLFFVER